MRGPTQGLRSLEPLPRTQSPSSEGHLEPQDHKLILKAASWQLKYEEPLEYLKAN